MADTPKNDPQAMREQRAADRAAQADAAKAASREQAEIDRNVEREAKARLKATEDAEGAYAETQAPETRAHQAGVGGGKRGRIAPDAVFKEDAVTVTAPVQRREPPREEMEPGIVPTVTRGRELITVSDRSFAEMQRNKAARDAKFGHDPGTARCQTCGNGYRREDVEGNGAKYGVCPLDGDTLRFTVADPTPGLYERIK